MFGFGQASTGATTVMSLTRWRPLHRPFRAGVGTAAEVVRRRVLIVEDEALIAMSLEAMLGDIGHHVVAIASNAEDALRLAVEQGPELVLMDVRLGPVGDEGIHAAVAIRRRIDAVVIFVTAYADQALAERLDAMLPGAMLLAKPVDEHLVADTIEKAMRRP